MLRRFALVVAIGLVAVPSGKHINYSPADKQQAAERLNPVGEPGSFAAGPLGGTFGDRSFGAGITQDAAGHRAIPAPAPAKRTALIVGINNPNGGAPLPGSITDATNLRDALLAYGFQRNRIKMLLEDDATASNIRKSLDALARRTPRDGVGVFAVATHTRRRGGRNELLTADGARISSTELAMRLSKVRSRMWIALPTCYAGGYALPGIVGPRRIATFASSKDQQTYQIGSAGSYLMINMVREAMLERHAPGSVEDAFRYAVARLKREAPNRVPTMSDGIKGELSLGRVPAASLEDVASPRDGGKAPAVGGASGVASPPNEPAPPPSPPPRRSGVRPGVCGPLSYNCSN